MAHADFTSDRLSGQICLPSDGLRGTDLSVFSRSSEAFNHRIDGPRHFSVSLSRVLLLESYVKDLLLSPKLLSAVCLSLSLSVIARTRRLLLGPKA